MKIITEPEFFAKLKEKLDNLVKLSPEEQPSIQLHDIRFLRTIKSVMGPGRSGAIASVYASHYLGAVWLPAMMKVVPQVLRPVLVIDTATISGASLRKLANRVKADYQLALFTEPPRVKFWYEERERPEYVAEVVSEAHYPFAPEIVSYGAKCAQCGFEYREYQGHIIPCPRCALEKADLQLAGGINDVRL